ncbi:hypothetical protein EN738_17865 [Mesorhizobium sp. M4B.F.Ca.ET.017.02.2.1]|nr:hypothetical protein EN738_17865 [Mesorhizobium sp. M4B.F.Ca.ET.017.02.2.1]
MRPASDSCFQQRPTACSVPSLARSGEVCECRWTSGSGGEEMADRIAGAALVVFALTLLRPLLAIAAT